MKSTGFCAILALAMLVAIPLAGAAQETVLYRFAGLTDGYLPIGRLVVDKDGALYGTASGGSARASTAVASSSD